MLIPSFPYLTNIKSPYQMVSMGRKSHHYDKNLKKKIRQKAIMLVHDLYYGEKEGTKVTAGLRRFRRVGSAGKA